MGCGFRANRVWAIIYMLCMLNSSSEVFNTHCFCREGIKRYRETRNASKAIRNHQVLWPSIPLVFLAGSRDLLGVHNRPQNYSQTLRESFDSPQPLIPVRFVA